MNNPNEIINDFSHLVANEVEVESEVVNKQKLEHKATIDRTKEPFFEIADYTNGAIYVELGYCWSQTITDIEIHVRIPDNIKAKQLKVIIAPTSISVTNQINGEHKTILSGILSEKCKATDAMWTITGRNKLNINIDKMREMWWEKLFPSETNKVDISKIDCSRPIEELSEETQSHINQIQFDERQKLKGEFTSEQIKQHELLRKAWNAEGSPFKGQPFDPNSVSFQN